jgi:hypothetical protein
MGRSLPPNASHVPPEKNYKSHAREITSCMPLSSSSSSAWDPYFTVFPQMVGLIHVVWLIDLIFLITLDFDLFIYFKI